MRTLLMVSGGDSPGINAALYRFVQRADASGDQVVGAVGGIAGAADGHLLDLHPESLAPMMTQGGAYLASSREPVLHDPLNRVRLVETISRLRINNIVLLGGDGTLRHIPPILHDMGIPCVGIPTTIDNDVPGTDETIGFDSACNAALRVIDGLLATARALPGRIFSVETLGGSTGFLALDIAFAVGADVVLMPEFEYDEDWLVERLRMLVAGRRRALIVLSEGVAGSRTFADDLQARHQLRVRDTRLGHGQRGAAPTHRDLALAFRMADAAFVGLHDGVAMGTVVSQSGQVTLCEALVTSFPARQPDRALYAQINDLPG